MDSVAAFVCATPGARHFALEELPGGIIDYIFTITNPNLFYLLAVLRLVSKRLWNKIPLTIYTYLADVGASFCGDLPVLRWIYSTTGIHHPSGCIKSARLAGHVDVLKYLTDYLDLKAHLDAISSYTSHAPNGWLARSIPSTRIVPYVLYLLSQAASLCGDYSTEPCLNVLIAYYEFMNTENIREIASVLLTNSHKSEFLASVPSIMPSLLEQVVVESKELDDVDSPGLIEIAVLPSTDITIARRILSNSRFLNRIKPFASILGVRDPVETVLAVRDIRRFKANSFFCRDEFVKLIEATELKFFGTSYTSHMYGCDFGLAFYRIYIQAMWSLPQVGREGLSLSPQRFAKVLVSINDERIASVLDQLSLELDPWSTFAAITITRAMQEKNFFIIKWFASAHRDQWPLRMNDIFKDGCSGYSKWSSAGDVFPTESIEALFREFKEPNQGAWIYRNQHFFENRASLYEVVKTYGLVQNENYQLDFTLKLLPAFFLAAYHDREGAPEQVPYNGQNHTAHTAFEYAFTARRFGTHLSSPFGSLPVARGPQSSLVRKRALLDTDPVLLHILLRTAQLDFEERFPDDNQE